MGARMSADLVRVHRTPAYYFRRLGWWLRSPEPACLSYRCPKPRVGMSKWCRQHTDEILETEDWEEFPLDGCW